MEKLEQAAKEYELLRQRQDHSSLGEVAVAIIDAVSSQNFSLPVNKDALSSGGVTTFIYENDASYPALFAFIAEVLHTTLPIAIGSAKLGPGEVLVSKQDKDEAKAELFKSVNELRQLVHAKRSEMLAKHASASSSSS